MKRLLRTLLGLGKCEAHDFEYVGTNAEGIDVLKCGVWGCGILKEGGI